MWLVLSLAVALAGLTAFVVWMPGESFDREQPPLTESEKTLATALRAHVETLASTIGNRSVGNYENLERAADYIRQTWKNLGYEVQTQEYQPSGYTEVVQNLYVSIPGARNNKVFVIGAHYDSVGTHCPGANDNASGIAGVLELSRLLRDSNSDVDLVFAAFVNEEPPFFMSSSMGSYVFAESFKKAGKDVVGMISLETIGYFSDTPGSQRYPFPFSFFYPNTGNFIAFVSNMRSHRLLRDLIALFRTHAKFPSEGAAAPALVPGVSWSDQWSFWKFGFPAIMLTDTAPFRYPDYHLTSDTPEKLDYNAMARIVSGLEQVIRSYPM